MDLFSFGREEAQKYGAVVRGKLAGKVISKRKIDDGKPGSLRYEAEHLGIEGFDMFDLLRTLEGLCYLQDADEIEDGLYRVHTERSSVDINITLSPYDLAEIKSVLGITSQDDIHESIFRAYKNMLNEKGKDKESA